MVWTWHVCSSAYIVLTHWCHTVFSVDISTIQMQSLINLLIFGIKNCNITQLMNYLLLYCIWRIYCTKSYVAHTHSRKHTVIYTVPMQICNYDFFNWISHMFVICLGGTQLQGSIAALLRWYSGGGKCIVAAALTLTSAGRAIRRASLLKTQTQCFGLLSVSILHSLSLLHLNCN